LHFSPQAAGEFVLARTASDDGFMLQVRQEATAGTSCPAVAFNTAAVVEIGGHTVALYPERSPPLAVDGVPTRVPGNALTLPDGSLVARHGRDYHIYSTEASLRHALSVFILSTFGACAYDVASMPPDDTESSPNVTGKADGADGGCIGDTL
jgi:hypothetical protein